MFSQKQYFTAHFTRIACLAGRVELARGYLQIAPLRALRPLQITTRDSPNSPRPPMFQKTLMA